VLAAAAAAVSFTAQYRMADATCHLPAIAAEPGWRNLAIWAMPPAAYALASDTLIGVVRAWALARHQHLTGDAGTPLAILGGLLLWLLRILCRCPGATARRPGRG
jgi:hypothetical protein